VKHHDRHRGEDGVGLDRLRREYDSLKQRHEESLRTIRELEQRNRNLQKRLQECQAELAGTVAEFRREIEQRKEAQAQIRESEQEYRAVFENSRDGIVITTKEGNFVDVNRAFADLVLCVSKEDALGRKIQHFYAHPEERARMRERLDRLGSVTNFELKFRRMDGSVIDTLHTIGVRHDRNGQIIGYQGIMRDITDQKKADQALRQARDELEMRVSERTAELAEANEGLRKEIAERARAQEALKDSEERLRAIFETATDCIFIKDRSLRYTLVNPYMENLLQIPGAEVVGLTDEDLFGSAAGAHLKEVDSRVLNGETIEEEHTRPVKGQQMTFLDIRSPMRDNVGEVVGICGISRNITERRTSPLVSQPATKAYPAPAMQSSLAAAMLAAQQDSIILLTGESGTGKDFLAKHIHSASRRASGPFYAINCAAISPELAESELFGHEPGAFTGADRQKKGRFELAEGGTLLLNEIGELPLPVQAKLLTFLDTMSFSRVGGGKNITVNTRLIAATNRDLEKEVAEARFRADLFYRLNVFSIHVPPLRDRMDDLPTLVQELIARLAAEMQLPPVPEVSPHIMTRLRDYNWPGNVRELRNVLERALILSGGGPLRTSHFGLGRRHSSDRGAASTSYDDRPLCEMLGEVERSLLEDALRRSGWNKAGAARMLGISRYALRRHMRKLGVTGR
jgi:PAS domain S-box-containing protein